MTTAAPSTALATIQPAFTDPERLTLAGFLAGYRGLTREAYALDLRQFTTWCRTRSLPLSVSNGGMGIRAMAMCGSLVPSAGPPAIDPSASQQLVFVGVFDRNGACGS
jgi:hypothetical protein